MNIVHVHVHVRPEFVEVFKQASVPLYISYYRRYLAKFRQVKQIIANGELGAIVAIQGATADRL